MENDLCVSLQWMSLNNHTCNVHRCLLHFLLLIWSVRSIDLLYFSALIDNHVHIETVAKQKAEIPWKFKILTDVVNALVILFLHTFMIYILQAFPKSALMLTHKSNQIFCNVILQSLAEAQSLPSNTPPISSCDDIIWHKIFAQIRLSSQLTTSPCPLVMPSSVLMRLSSCPVALLLSPVTPMALWLIPLSKQAVTHNASQPTILVVTWSHPTQYTWQKFKHILQVHFFLFFLLLFLVPFNKFPKWCTWCTLQFYDRIDYLYTQLLGSFFLKF